MSTAVSSRPRSRSLIFSIYGGFVRPLGGWIAVADLIILMQALGVDEQSVRSAVSRLNRKGLLVRSRPNAQIGYELSAEAVAIIEEGDLRIFRVAQPADLADGWVVAVFSVPEHERDKRHQLRSELTSLGFGSIGGGVWLAPRRVLERAQEDMRRLGLAEYVDLFEAHYSGFDEQAQLAERAWDLASLDSRYGDYVVAVGGVVSRWRRAAGSDRDAFVDYLLALDRWRKLPYLDPGLPPELLPDDWHGVAAWKVFNDVVALLKNRAQRYVKSVVSEPR